MQRYETISSSVPKIFYKRTPELNSSRQTVYFRLKMSVTSQNYGMGSPYAPLNKASTGRFLIEDASRPDEYQFFQWSRSLLDLC